MKLKFLSFTMAAVACVSLAHEGHNHGVPGTVAAPKGGEIKAAFGSYFELVTEGKKLTVYPYNEKVEPLTLTEIGDISATAKVPKGKEQKVDVIKVKDAFQSEFDPGKNHRFTYTLKFKIKGQEDSVSFNVEKN